MAAATSNATVWKLDDENAFATNCFPARGIARRTNEGSGSWIVSYAYEQHRRYNALAPLPDNTQTTTDYIDTVITSKNKKKEPVPISQKSRCLDKEFLLNHHHVERPSDLCSIKISDCDLEYCVPSTFKDFTNVAYINASENLLSLQYFRNFVNLRELELSVNGIRNIKVEHTDFPNLQVLDLSYNNLSSNDVLNLGVIPKLKVLSLTGNGLNSIHPELCQTFEFENSVPKQRFASLELLNLDDNNLHDMATFAALAALPNLRELNLDKNRLSLIPYLKVLGEKVISETHSDRVKSAKTNSQITTPEAVSEKNSPRSMPSSRRKMREANSLDRISEVSQSRMMLDLSTPPPYQHLQSLSIAHNEITLQEHVLAVAGWPELQNLVLTGNPIVTKTSGEPPVLSHYLNKRLGINVVRFKPKAPMIRPPITVNNRPHRKVKTRVPKILKQPVDVMLEHYKKPPIAPPKLTEISLTKATVVSETSNKTEEEIAKENVFLTQFNDIDNDFTEDIFNRETNSIVKINDSHKLFTNVDLYDLKSNAVQELLSDAKPDPEIYESLSIQGNLKMLNTLLDHPAKSKITQRLTQTIPEFVYTAEKTKNTAALDIRGKQVKDSRTQKSEQLIQALELIKIRPGGSVEIPLHIAINENNKDKHLQALAEEHLEKIEEKYRVVREESLRASRQRQREIKEASIEIKLAQDRMVALL